MVFNYGNIFREELNIYLVECNQYFIMVNI